MKLPSKNVIYYKGIGLVGGLANFKQEVGDTGTIQIGFLSGLLVATIYAEPELTGDTDDTTIIIECVVPTSSIEDRTEEFTKLGYDDVSVDYPKEWRDEGPWTVRDSGSAHNDESAMSCYDGASFVYIGVPWLYKVIKVINGQSEWERVYKEITTQLGT